MLADIVKDIGGNFRHTGTTMRSQGVLLVARMISVWARNLAAQHEDPQAGGKGDDGGAGEQENRVPGSPPWGGLAKGDAAGFGQEDLEARRFVGLRSLDCADSANADDAPGRQAGQGAIGARPGKLGREHDRPIPQRELRLCAVGMAWMTSPGVQLRRRRCLPCVDLGRWWNERAGGARRFP